MKSLLFLVCCLGALAAEEFELRPNHVVVHSGQGLEAQFSHLPDESNFQASGGAALGSFGGFTRVVVLLVVLLGVLYHGFVPAAIFTSDAVRPSVSLPVRKMSGADREEAAPVVLPPIHPSPPVVATPELRAEVTQKINNKAAKKNAKKIAKKLLEAAKSPETTPAPLPVSTVEEVVEQKEEKREIVEVVEPAEKEEEIVKKVEQDKAKEQEQEREEEREEEEVPKAHVVEEERQEELPVNLEKSGWVKNPPRPFERTSVTIKRAKRMYSIHQLLSARQNRQSDEILEDLDLGSFVVDPRTVNCPMKLAPPPLLLEESSPFDVAEQEAPASIEPVRDKIVSPPVVQEFVPQNNVSIKPAPPKIEAPCEWAFNSHKKTSWMQKQSHSVWPADPLTRPELLSFGVPWTPIRTPCKFASACKKPGCQFTHPGPAPAPAWLPPATVF